MLWPMSSLRGKSLRATDGGIGELRDVLFDDATWTVRYLVADTGGWLSGRRVLLAPAAVTVATDALGDALAVDLSREAVENSPPVTADRPVSRQQEEALHAHYGWLPYWSGASMVTGPLPEPRQGPGLEFPLGEAEGAGDGDPHLRSMREIDGYHIRATDGDIGHVEDFLIDVDGWSVRYFVIDTRNWLPGKTVIVAPGWVERVEWPLREVYVNLTRERIKSCPEYDPSETVARDYEERLFQHYEKIPYWT